MFPSTVFYYSFWAIIVSNFFVLAESEQNERLVTGMCRASFPKLFDGFLLNLVVVVDTKIFHAYLSLVRFGSVLP